MRELAVVFRKVYRALDAWDQRERTNSDEPAISVEAAGFFFRGAERAGSRPAAPAEAGRLLSMYGHRLGNNRTGNLLQNPCGLGKNSAGR